MKKLYIILAFAMMQVTFHAFPMKRNAPYPDGHVNKQPRTEASPYLSLNSAAGQDFAQDFEAGGVDEAFLREYENFRHIQNPTHQDKEALANVRDTLSELLGYTFDRNGDAVKTGDRSVAIERTFVGKDVTTALVFEKRSSSKSGE